MVELEKIAYYLMNKNVVLKSLMLSKVVLSLVIMILSLFNCSSSEKFKRLNKPSENLSNFYLLRPDSPAYAIWSFEVQIYKYKDKFDPKENPLMIKKFKLGVAEYIFLKLPRGYYKLTSPFFRDSEKIVYLDGKSESFLHYYLFADGFFSKTELFIKEIKKEEALKLLLEGPNMIQSVSSDRP